jgi:hypothetical protein
VCAPRLCLLQVKFILKHNSRLGEVWKLSGAAVGRQPCWQHHKAAGLRLAAAGMRLLLIISRMLANSV